MNDTLMTDHLRPPSDRATSHDVPLGRLADPLLVAAVFVGLNAAQWGLLKLADVGWLTWLLDNADRIGL